MFKNKPIIVFLGTYPPEVKWQINQNNKQEYEALAEELNQDSLVAG